MGTTSSRMLFAQILKRMLRSRGAKVGQQQLCHFLEFVEKVCPWFPKEGSINLELWLKVGKQLQDYYDQEGPSKFPVDVFSLWGLIKESLDPRQGTLVGNSQADAVASSPEGIPNIDKEIECPSSAPPLVEGLDEPLYSSGAPDLEEEATKYNYEEWPPFPLIALTEKMKIKDKKDKSENTHPSNPLDVLWFNWKWKQKEQALLKKRSLQPSVLAGLDPFPEVAHPDPQLDSPPVPQLSSPAPHPLSALQATLQAAAERGEDLAGFQMVCPVFEEPDQQGQMVCVHRPLPFKQLKKLKVACAQYGPMAPFTPAMLESLSSDALPPGDWKQIAKACLSGGDYLLWKTEFTEQCQKMAELNRATGNNITYDMLAGEGEYADIANQLLSPGGAYTQINTAVKRAWQKLPMAGQASEDLSKIRQGPDKPFQEFVARLLQTASRLLGDADARLLLVKQLAYENANSLCQAAIRSFRKKGDLGDYIRLCTDIGPAYTQGLAMAAALQGKTIKEVLFQQGARFMPKM
ncbi:endogenous retrovirus group K member 7 Gag polyprotein-like [Heterocephalus glaber]|uniref:Endogenous retrovirus group K member 7 Gag polyprotein-like n=1 Tax=Heterocephalus glaber TaxID=10181 RepID=A0AAX6S3A9_HETGA|nr:endogenous retrovirus group K member 7 Gag polyprotein-like [Heterocephalus glaber]